jgi:type II secretory pathway component PulF
MAWQIRTQGKKSKGRLQQTSEEGMQKILKERRIEWNQVRAIVQNHVRSEALCKPSAPAGRIGLTR